MRTRKVEKFRASRVRNFAVSNSHPSCQCLSMCCVLGAAGCSSQLHSTLTLKANINPILWLGDWHTKRKNLPQVLNLLNGRSDSKVHQRSTTIPVPAPYSVLRPTPATAACQSKELVCSFRHVTKPRVSDSGHTISLNKSNIKLSNLRKESNANEHLRQETSIFILKYVGILKHLNKEKSHILVLHAFNSIAWEAKAGGALWAQTWAT